MKRSHAALVLAMMLLTGCGAAGSRTVVVCPTLVEYQPDTQRRAADELAAMATGAVVPMMMADYGRLRDQVRACNPRR